MTRKKVFLIICSIITVVLIALTILALSVRSHAATSVSEKLSQKLEPYGISIETELSPVLSAPKCFSEVKLTTTSNDVITLENICLTSSIISALDSTNELSITCDKISGSITQNTLKDLKKVRTENKAAEVSIRSRSKSLTLQIKETDITLKADNNAVRWRANNTQASLMDATISFHSSSDLSVDLAKSPVAIKNLPHIDVSAEANLNEKSASLKVATEPPIELSYFYKGTLLDAAFSSISAELKRENTTIAINDINIGIPDMADATSAQIETLSIGLKDLKPSIQSISEIHLISPTVKIELAQILEQKSVKEHPILNTLIQYWKKDAGSILGKAPKNSVRREDVQKSQKVFRKNPIPKETLAKLRTSFDKLQKKVLSWPAIDIYNGTIELSHKESHYNFNAISFNTAELFENTQKFRLAFNVRNASAAFVTAYETDSPYPVIAFEIQNMASADFLHLINMPVPEQNSGTITLGITSSISDEDLSLTGNIEFKEFSFYQPKISPNLVQDVNASAEFTASYIFAEDKLNITPLTLTSGPVTASGFIKIANVRSEPVIEFELGAKDIPCNDIPKAIPKGFLPTITDLRLEGSTMSPKITGKIPWKNPLISTLKESGFEDRCYPVSVEPHIPEELNAKDYKFTTDYTYFTDKITVGPGTKDFTPLSEIPPYVKAAMFLTEDKRFFDHSPLRIAFIERALRLNLNQRSYVYGGSTIAQQLTKNLFLNRTKNLARKLEEAFVAWRLETVVPRLRIFELYINMIEFGPDIYGITKASKFYFDKKPSELSPLEGAFLASLKVSPSKGGRFYKTGFAQNGRWWHKRMRYILKTLAENGYISVQDVIAAYDWTPQFVYPSNPGDFRQKWLNQYGEYLRTKQKPKEGEAHAPQED